MRSITVQNYRCFGEQQTAQLAPLTLFVGENSSGKTSLAAMVRALWDISYAERVPDFKGPPYDLGSFEEIVHHGGARDSNAEMFSAAFEIGSDVPSRLTRETEFGVSDIRLEVTFGPKWGAPVPTRRRISRGDYWVEQSIDGNNHIRFDLGTPSGVWEYEDPEIDRFFAHNGGIDSLPPLDFVSHLIWRERSAVEDDSKERDPPLITEEEQESIMDLIHGRIFSELSDSRSTASSRPFAGAPTRSHPRRTYDPASVAPDAEGDYVPMYLAQLSLRDASAWERLQSRLGEFGREAGLFHELNVRHLGKTAGSPFQIEVRTSDIPAQSPPLNLADVGYGVSQALPLVAELLRPDGPRMMLLQQPEVHLHPSAEAALGSLFCRVVSSGKKRRRQLVVETHSDFIIDRVCMSVRDETVDLVPEDVSIVYFERTGLGVRLHSLRVDDDGNLLDVPSGYRQFFMDESVKYLGA